MEDQYWLCETCSSVASYDDPTGLDFYHCDPAAAEKAWQAILDALREIGPCCPSGDYDNTEGEACDCCGNDANGRRWAYESLE